MELHPLNYFLIRNFLILYYNLINIIIIQSSYNVQPSYSNYYNFDDVNVPIRDQGGSYTKVNIGQNSWVGNGALIMADVGENCVVAAGSVVINAVPDNAIVGGNPAKVIKLRIES